MAVFKPIAWQPNEPISKNKLSQMVENDQYLFENTANMVYRDLTGIRTATSLKLIAGVFGIAATNGSTGAWNVSYAGEFDSGIAPIITTGTIITSMSDYQAGVNIRGHGSALPNDAGFQAVLDSPGKILTGSVYLHYMALGISSRISAAPE